MHTADVSARALQWMDVRLGGPARRRVIVALALVVALDAADKATLGAVAAELQKSLSVSNLQLGVLASVSLGVGGLTTIPLGILTDRVNRTRLLMYAIVLWTGALVLAGASDSFEMLLVSRVALGGMAATAGPAIASLAGDYFPAAERGRIYGFILSGEIIGAGFGFVVAGELTALLSWRWGFWSLVLPGAAVAVALLRWLPEPARGGASRLPAGAQEISDAADVAEKTDGVCEPSKGELTLAQRVAEEDGVAPNEELVLDGDPGRMKITSAIRYVLAVPTNRILIAASALGWFFFAGVRTFAIILLRGQYGLGQSVATGLLVMVGVGGLLGVLVGGRLSHSMIRRGRVDGRVLVAIVAYGLTPLLLAPALLSTVLWISMPLFFAGTLALGSANPPVDAGRLDVMHHRLWGRAESIRTVARTWAEASAPVLFGLISGLLGPGRGSPFLAQAARGQKGSAVEVQGLRYTFLIMLVPLVVGALLGLRARRTYPEDVATAAASEREAPDGSDGKGSQVASASEPRRRSPD
jgi:MFS family permease